jgi:hypothetical protein
MGKKKWKQKARRRKILLDAQRSLKAYWKEEAQKRGRTLALYSLVLDGAELELEDARRWSSAWKAAAKKGRDEAKDYKGIAHDWYSWYQVAVDRLRVELSTAQVEAAQLREALAAWLAPWVKVWDSDNFDETMLLEEMANVKTQAAIKGGEE